MARPLWLVASLRRLFARRFLLARLTRLPLAGQVVDRLFFTGDDLLQVPAERAIALNRPIALPEETVLPWQVAEHFVAQAAHHWLMNACICRQASRCAHYPLDLGCLFLGEAVLGIHPKLGRLVTKEEALAQVRRASERGLVHLVGRSRFDALWLGVGPGHRLLTICHCCPCCCLFRILPHLAPEIGRKVARMPGVTLRVTGRCLGCGACAQGVCFVQAIRMDGGRAVIGAACRGCGRCAGACPHRAIEITMDQQAVVQAIARLAPLLDLSSSGEVEARRTPRGR